MNLPTSATPHTTSANRARAALTWHDLAWLGAIVVIGINLRPLLTSISPLMTTIRDATGLSASLLSSLPVVAFGAAALTRSVGETRGCSGGFVAA
jgi:CP family cyanate transporter-like MFS transporter